MFVLEVNAQNYLISFAGSGESATIGTVKVENMTKGTSLELNGSDILQLTGSTGIYSADYTESRRIKIYPNPFYGSLIIEIDPPEAGNATISLYEITGKILSQTSFFLEAKPQDLRIEGLGKGFCLMDIRGKNYNLSGKLMGMGQTVGTISIAKNENNVQPISNKNNNYDHKGTGITVTMNFTAGDRFKFTGISGNYKTVITDIPSSDKTIMFNFISCADGNGNHYPIVEIGSAKGDFGSGEGKGVQTWMAENLKTTKYNDGTDIPLVTDNTAWKNLTTPGYCWFNNDLNAYGITFGALYNWHAVSTGKLCPAGWHVPSKDEWTALMNNLGGSPVAGGKLKESGTVHWYTPNKGATNETGFTALPGGARIYSLGFYYELLYGFWWSSTRASNPIWAWYATMYYDRATLSIMDTGLVEEGYAVRCVKN